MPPSPALALVQASPADRDLAEQTIPRERASAHATPPPACDPDLWLLHVCYQRTREPAALEALVDEYRGMALALARRMHRGAEPLDDLQQIALEGLVRSLRSFDCAQGTPFVGYATPTILGSLKRHYRDHGWNVRAPRRAHELAAPIREGRERLTARLGRAPTAAELAVEIGVEPSEVETADVALAARNMVRLDAPVRTDDGDGLGREVGVTEGGFDHAEARVDLAHALDVLDPRDREVLGLSFYDELTQSEIAQRYGVSQMQVSRWIRSALARLRTRMEAGATP